MTVTWRNEAKSEMFNYNCHKTWTMNLLTLSATRFYLGLHSQFKICHHESAIQSITLSRSHFGLMNGEVNGYDYPFTRVVSRNEVQMTNTRLAHQTNAVLVISKFIIDNKFSPINTSVAFVTKKLKHVTLPLHVQLKRQCQCIRMRERCETSAYHIWHII